MSSSHDALVNSFKVKSKETIEFYQQWATQYDQDLSNTGYNGPKQVVALGLKYLTHNMRILDVCAGTGHLSKLLRPHGLIRIDAHDGSYNMLQAAKENNLYDNYYEEYFCPGQKPKFIPQNHYDAFIMSGAFCPGHLDGSHMPEMLAPLKKNGKFIAVIRKIFLTEPNEGQMKSTKQVFDELERKNVWKLVEATEVENYVEDYAGLALVYEKLE